MKTVSCPANRNLNPLFSNRISAFLDGVRGIVADLFTTEYISSSHVVPLTCGSNLNNFLLSCMAFIKQASDSGDGGPLERLELQKLVLGQVKTW